jgi:large subunit ribosomal protein L21
MYAIVALSGKQYHMEPGKLVNVELNSELSALKEGNSFSMDKVLCVNDNNNLKVGNPLLNGASVKATIVKHGKGKKIRTETYLKRKDKKRTVGHRQPFVQLRIEDIQPGS